MKLERGRVWVMPLGAEPLDADSRQLWYATEDGSGSVTDIGTVEALHLSTDPEQTG